MLICPAAPFVGRLSTKLTLLSDVDPGLVIVKVSVDVPGGRVAGLRLFGEKDFSMLALTISTYRKDPEKSAL